MNERKVMLAWCTAGEVKNAFAMSVIDTVMRDGTVAVVRSLVSGPRLAEARNALVDQFAATDCGWLWFVDSDMVFKRNTLARLLEVANAETHPIVGALCYTADNEPTMTRILNAELDSERITTWPEGEVIEVDTTGTGCVLIHRRVFTALKKKYGLLPSGAENPFPWFAEGLVSVKGMPFGEDTAFMIRARSMGIPVHVHTGVKVGHVKSAVVGEVA